MRTALRATQKASDTHSARTLGAAKMARVLARTYVACAHPAPWAYAARPRHSSHRPYGRAEEELRKGTREGAHNGRGGASVPNEKCIHCGPDQEQAPKPRHPLAAPTDTVRNHRERERARAHSLPHRGARVQGGVDQRGRRQEQCRRKPRASSLCASSYNAKTQHETGAAHPAARTGQLRRLRGQQRSRSCVPGPSISVVHAPSHAQYSPPVH